MRCELLRLLLWPMRELVRHLGVAEKCVADAAVRFGTYLRDGAPRGLRV